MPSLFKNPLSEKTKNLSFFVIVLQILLFISGSVEINPGPPSPQEKELSFAVWNLDSLPARDFARIPLIETLQSTYDFDILDMCESMLKIVFQMTRFSSMVFPLMSSGQTKLLTLEMGVFVYIIRNPYL